MSTIQTICQKADHLKKIIFDPSYRFESFGSRGFYNHLSDEEYIRRMFKARMGYPLDLQNPKTFNEKLQWLKLYDRKPIYTTMVDKYAAKEYVASLIGNEHVIPTFGVWDRFEDIDFDSLPNQFVLKCTHDSGGLVIVKDKSKFNLENARKKINQSLRRNYYNNSGEWAYKNISHRILAEKYMTDSNVERNRALDASAGSLLDYKLYCFQGEPRFFYIGFANIKNGEKDDQLSFFDLDWNPAPFYRKDHEPLPFSIDKPENFQEMIDIARILSQGIPFVRVDLYNIDLHIYFSEMTFSPGGGYGRFYPDEWERKLGDWIVLPELKK